MTQILWLAPEFENTQWDHSVSGKSTSIHLKWCYEAHFSTQRTPTIVEPSPSASPRIPVPFWYGLGLGMRLAILYFYVFEFTYHICGCRSRWCQGDHSWWREWFLVCLFHERPHLLLPAHQHLLHVWGSCDSHVRVMWWSYDDYVVVMVSNQNKQSKTGGGKGCEWGYVVMWWSCDGHVMIMWQSCDGHVMIMWQSCDDHVTVMWWSCDDHVTVMWWSCDSHVMVMWWIVYVRELYILYIQTRAYKDQTRVHPPTLASLTSYSVTPENPILYVPFFMVLMISNLTSWGFSECSPATWNCSPRNCSTT